MDFLYRNHPIRKSAKIYGWVFIMIRIKVRY